VVCVFPEIQEFLVLGLVLKSACFSKMSERVDGRERRFAAVVQDLIELAGGGFRLVQL